jgi:hypothetical protein
VRQEFFATCFRCEAYAADEGFDADGAGGRRAPSTKLDKRMKTMNRAFNARKQLFFHAGGRGNANRNGGCDHVNRQSRRPSPGQAKLATLLGGVAAGILLLFLAVSAVVSVVVNMRYGQVARQHAQVAVASDMAGHVPAAAIAL